MMSIELLNLFPDFAYNGCCQRIPRNPNNLVFVSAAIRSYKFITMHASLSPMQVSNNETSLVVWDDNMQNGGSGKAQSIIYFSKKFEDDLHVIGTKLKQHEENMKMLKSQKYKFEDSIRDLQVTLGKYHSSGTPKIEDKDNSRLQTEEEANLQILRHEKSAAAILCQLKTCHGTQAAPLPLIKDVVGIVATLGKVDDDNLSRLFSEYLGEETMLAIVCKTYEGVKALEVYDKESRISRSSGLHGIGGSIGKNLEGRFLVICLEKLRPYAGEFLENDRQRRLGLLKPRLPNGECPPGFLGFAVNMINVDNINLLCVTASGHGLRETLFYNIFSRLQVYKTRADMLQALPCISDGALSLDGGMIKSPGVLSLGNRDEVDVIFPKPDVTSRLPESYFEAEKQIEELKLKREKLLEDVKREQTLLDNAKFNFMRKKDEFLKFLAESSLSVSQQIPPAPSIFSPR